MVEKGAGSKDFWKQIFGYRADSSGYRTGASTAPKLIDAVSHDAAVLKQKEAHDAKSFTF